MQHAHRQNRLLRYPNTRHKACLAPAEGRETVSLLWAEAKRGVVADIYKPLVQLILTIGKARTFETFLPPPFLAAFDAEKIAFIPYKEILPFFSLNDFNWNTTPSDETSREFGLLYDAVKETLERTSYLFRYDVHENELREFIKQHLSESSELIQTNKNNFVSIYQRWLAQVQPSIDVNWEGLKKTRSNRWRLFPSRPPFKQQSIYQGSPLCTTTRQSLYS